MHLNYKKVQIIVLYRFIELKLIFMNNIKGL